MKKMFLLSILLVVTCIANAQLSEQNKKLLTKNNVLYLRDNGHDFRVDTRTVTVKLKEGETLDTNNLTVQRQNKLGYIDITVPDGMDVEKFAKILDENENYELVEYNTYAECCITFVNDPQITYQWHHNKIHTSYAWDYETGDSLIRVAVIDNGVDKNHPDIGFGNDNYKNINELLGWDYVVNNTHTNPTHYHGTFVAGIIGAKTNNGVGIAGVTGGNAGPGVTIIPYRTGSGTNLSNSAIDDAIIDATDKGAKVINMSFGSSAQSSIADALNYAFSHGVTLVASSGNENLSTVFYPARDSKVIAVGATDEYDYRAYFSNYGTGLDIVAPGTNIYSTSLYNSYSTDSGTSFSAPQVAGVAALMLAVNPLLTPSQIRKILIESATKITHYTYDGIGWNNQVGYGCVNAKLAVKGALPRNIVGPSLVCDSASYYVDGIPNNFTIVWELGNEYYNDSEDLFKTDYPANNQCLIVRDNLLTLNDTLIARVYDEDGILVRTLKQKVRTRTKAEFPISVEDNSWPPVLSSASVAEDDPAKVPSGALVKMGSSRFNGMNITSSGACTYLLHSGDSVKLRTTGIASIQCINSTNCDQFTLYFYTKKKPIIPNDPPIIGDSLIIEPLVLDEPRITGGRSMISVTLNQVIENEDNKDDFQAIPLSNDVSWNISIYRYTDGKRMYDQKVQGSHIQVNTYGWSTGIYIVRIVCGNQIFSRKINL